MLLRNTVAVVAASIMLGFASVALADNEAAPKVQKRYAHVNSLKLYYEIHGSGKPLILLHGGFGAIEMFGSTLAELARSQQVIAVDLQGHGHTADIDRPLTFEGMADDIAELLKHLHIARADVMGYSMGGGVAVQMAFRHPEMVRKLVIVSAPFKRTGYYPEVRQGMAQLGPGAVEAMKRTPVYELYRKLAPAPEHWPVFVAKVGKLVQHDFDWSKQVAALRMPTLVVCGDADAFSPAHAAEFFALLGGGQRDAGWDGSGRPVNRLAILPCASHYDIFRSSLLAPAITTFLDAPLQRR